MKLATLAFVAAVALGIALVVASSFGYDAPSIGALIGAFGRHATTSLDAQPSQQQGRELPRIDVPSGTFHGPTGQPTLVGPSGPPPNE